MRTAGRRASWRITALLAALLTAPGAAPAEQPAGAAEQKPVAVFGRDNPSCREWSDGCQICAQPKDGAPICSTPGIACVSGPVACIKAVD